MVAATQQRRNYAPVVASDGTNFMVAYESRNSAEAASYVVQPVTSAGVAGAPTLAALGNLVFDTQHRLGVDLAWLGSRYRVLYARQGELAYKDYTTTGTAVADGPWSLAANHNLSALVQPSLAWDPVSGRWALAYLTALSTAQLYRFPTIDNRTADASTAFTSIYEAVDLKWNPQNAAGFSRVNCACRY